MSPNENVPENTNESSLTPQTINKYVKRKIKGAKMVNTIYLIVVSILKNKICIYTCNNDNRQIPLGNRSVILGTKKNVDFSQMPNKY